MARYSKGIDATIEFKIKEISAIISFLTQTANL